MAKRNAHLAGSKGGYFVDLEQAYGLNMASTDKAAKAGVAAELWVRGHARHPDKLHKVVSLAPS